MRSDNKHNSIIKKNAILRCAAAVFLAAVLLCGCSHEDEQITSVSQLNDPSHSVGVDTGAASEMIAEETFTEAEILHMDAATGYKAAHPEPESA